MLYEWKIKAFGVLVKVGKYELEDYEGNTKPVVDPTYKEAVSIYLATGEIITA